MQATTTIDRNQVARVIGLLAGTFIVAILVVGVIVADLGIGYEGAGRAVRQLPPPAALGR
jgi:hypothetical protein